MSSSKLCAMVAVAALFAGCKDAADEGDEFASGAWLEGSWRVEDVDNQGVIDNAMLRIDFGPDGRVSGRGGCNSFGGSYSYENGVATFSALAATEMACAPALMDLETKFFNRLEGDLAVSMTDDGALILSDAEGRILMRRMSEE